MYHINFTIMIRFIREVTKTLIVLFIWGMPIYLVVQTGKTAYIILLLLSLIVNVGVFAHYEALEVMSNPQNHNTDETTQETE